MPEFEDAHREPVTLVPDRMGTYRDIAVDSYPVAADASKLLEYGRVVWRHFPLIVVGAVLGLIAAIGVRKAVAPRFEARAMLEVRTPNERFLNREHLDPDSANREAGIEFHLGTELALLESEELKRRVLRHAGADPGKNARWAQGLKVEPAQLASAAPEAVEALNKGMSASVRTQTRLIEVRFRSTDAALASDVVNTTAEEFIAADGESSRDRMAQTGRLLSHELARLKRNLDDSGRALESYARRSNLLIANQTDNIHDRQLSQTQSELGSARAERILKQSQFEQAAKADAASLADVINDVTLKDYRTNVANLRRELADLSTTLAPGHYRIKKIQAQIASVEREAAAYRKNILDRISNDYKAAMRREELLAGTYDQESQRMSDEAAKSVQYDLLRSELNSNRQLYESMLQRVKEAEVVAAMRAANVRVVDPAIPPNAPAPPTTPQSGAIGTLAGALMAVGMAFWREYGTGTFKHSREAASFLRVPELGAIPPAQNGGGLLRRAGLPAPRDSRNLPLTLAEIESYRGVMASLACAGWNGVMGCCLVVTSPGTGEGKTRTTASLGMALARGGRRTLLIDGDLRRPALHTVFELPNDVGLRDLLEGRGDQPETLVQSTGVPNLCVLPSGDPLTEPAHLLDSQRMRDLINRLKRGFDTILIDTPPMLPLADARMLGRLAQGAILVLRAGRTSREAAQAARTRLASDGIDIAGVVLNDSQAWDGSYGYSYPSTANAYPNTVSPGS
ncbi:MAG: polysaccharide biosynthesis tyrosine autokinase [Bryobacteraceae bacterium]